MRKSELIAKIQEYNADLVWEIDSPKFYCFIGWNGGEKNDSYWLEHNLIDVTNKVLKELLSELKSVNNSLQ